MLYLGVGRESALRALIMDFNDLYILISLSKTKSLTKTSEEFEMKVPSVSKRLEKLELAFGQKIYYRKSKGIEFTRAGEELIELYSEILQKVEFLQQKLKGDIEKKETLTLSTTTAILVTTMGQYIKAFVEEYPKVVMTLLAHNSERELSQYSSDIIVWTYLKDRRDLKQELLYTYEFGLFASKSYLSKMGVPSDGFKTGQHRILKFVEFNTTPYGGGSNALFDFLPFSSQVETVYVNAGLTMYNMIKEGIGIGPVWTNRPGRLSDNLVRLFPEFTTKVETYIMHRKDLPSSHPGRLFAEHLKVFLLNLDKGALNEKNPT